MTEHKDIGLRLENWARWASERGARASVAPTYTACQYAEASRTGGIYDRENGIEPRDTPDDRDAYRIELTMRLISNAHRLLLWWTYIKQQHPGYVSRVMSFPINEFVGRFRAAQEAVEDLADNEGNR